MSGFPAEVGDPLVFYVSKSDTLPNRQAFADLIALCSGLTAKNDSAVVFIFFVMMTKLFYCFQPLPSSNLS